MKSTIDDGRTFKEWLCEPLVLASVGGFILTALGALTVILLVR